MKRYQAVFFLSLMVASSAFATNGYFTHGASNSSKAMAGAGVALPQDSLDVSNNPASIVFVNREMYGSIAFFSPDRQYTIRGTPSGMNGTMGLQPGSVRSESKFFAMPALSYNARPSQNAAWNVSFLARGGMNTDYRASTFYGGSHTGVDLMQGFLTATWAQRITARQALGLTAIGAYQRFEAQGLGSFAGYSHDASNLTNNAHDSSHGLGVKVGYIFQSTDNASLGLAYSPRIVMSRFDRYSGLFAQDGRFNVPAAFTAGVAYRPLGSRATVAVDYERIHYSDVRAVGEHLLPAIATSALGYDNGAGFGWDDMNVFKLGARYELSPKTTLRAGYSRANQPIPSSEVLFNILAPAVIEQHYTLGVTRQLLSTRGRFGFTVMYAPRNEVAGANPFEVPNQQSIELSMNEWESEFSYAVKF